MSRSSRNTHGKWRDEGMKGRLLRASESRHLHACTLSLRHAHSQRTCGKGINLQTGKALQQPEPEEVQIHTRLGTTAVF